MLLGDLLAQVERADASGNVAAMLDDLSLLTQVAAEARGDPDSYLLAAVRRFEREASPDDWVSLMSAVSRHADPSIACLQHIVRWALDRRLA